MKAGVDFGTTLVKVFWREDDDVPRYLSSADEPVEKIAERMSRAGVTRICATGIGPRDGFEAFQVIAPEEDPLANEVSLQARGVRYLPGDRLPQRFLLASVGTGTSYTEVDGYDVVDARHLGNPMGGGFIAGFGRLFMMGGPARIGQLAAAGKPPDTLMKDRLPALDGSPMGEFVISHFNRADVAMDEEDFAAGLVHCVAVSIVRDIMAKECPDVVFIGSTLRAYPSLRSSLERYLGMIGKTAHFPPCGEFAGAVGAYESLKED